MKFTRRKALATLGLTGLGGGAVFGSGAFTQLESDRDVTLNFSNDDEAALALTAGPQEDELSEVDVEQAGSGAENVSITVGQDEDGGGMVGDGVNLFRDVLTVENNGDNAVFLNVAKADDDPARAHQLRILAPIDSSDGGADDVAEADNGAELESKISGRTVGDDDVRDINVSDDHVPDDPQWDDEREYFRYALRDSAGDNYPGGVVELGHGESVNLSIEIETGPGTGAGEPFDDEYRFAARDVDSFDGSTLESEEDTFVLDPDDTTLGDF